MSAWIVSDEHIHAMVTSAFEVLDFCITDYHHKKSTTKDYYCNNRADCDVIGNILIKQNFASVNFRYGEDVPIPKYLFKYSSGWTPVEIIKSCHCYNYQSCENEEWENSLAQIFTRELISCMLHKLPGYEAAPWGIDKKKKMM